MEDGQPMGKSLMLLGAILILAGVLWTYGHRVPFLGRLPGDIDIKKDGFSFYFPITTGVVVSLVISLVVWLYRK